MHSIRLTRGGAVIAALVVAGIALIGLVAFNSRVQAHFGYAVPGDSGLPLYAYYGGRRYLRVDNCYSGNTCQPGKFPCSTTQQLQARQFWPLQQVSRMNTLFGPAQSLMAAPTPSGLTVMELYVPYGSGCFVGYGIEGGP